MSDPLSGPNLPGVPNCIRNLIGQADALLIQELTPDELDRFANAEQSIERLSKAKEELVRQVLARNGTDWRQRITPFEKSCLDRGDVAEGSLRVSLALREMLDDEWLEHRGLEQRLDQARQIHDELIRAAMERRAAD
jgi:hypothetical protein